VDEITQIKAWILKGDFVEFQGSKLETFMKCLNHPYFKNRFSNFQRILGMGGFGLVIEADFQLFEDRPETLPVAVKVNFGSVHEDTLEMIRNYASLMVNPDDVEIKDGGRDDLKVFDLSKHFDKMRLGNDSIKKDVSFVGMLYEAALISVYPEDDISKPPQNLSVTVAQLGFSSLKDDFLENAEGSETIRDRNSENVSKSIVQMSFGLRGIHANGFFHGDLSEKNIIVAGTKEDFYPLIIDFDFLKSRYDLLQMSIPFYKQAFDQSHPKFQEYVEYSKSPGSLIGEEDVSVYLYELDKIPKEAVSDVELKRAFESKKFCMFNLNITQDTINLINLSLGLLNKYIEKNLIRSDHPHIHGLKTKLESLKNSWEQKKEYLTSESLMEKLNEASNLELTSFDALNADLDRFFEKIEESLSASSDTQVRTVQEKPEDSKNELKDMLIV
jgi:tRNA A-37 threonylcarbamoyl transferase component Bud32